MAIGAGHDAGASLAGIDRVAMASDPAARHHEADEALVWTFVRNARQRVPPDEVARLVQLDDATEAGVERVGLPVELVAVQGHAGLEAQGVPGAQAAGDHAGALTRAREGGPDLGAPSPVDEQLEPVLARVAGARDERRDARDLALGDRVVAQRAEVQIGQRSEHLGGAWPLDGDERRRERPIVEHGPPAPEPRSQLVRDDRRVAGVGHDEEPLRPAAIRGANHRVLGPPDGQRPRVADERRGERVTGVFALDVELAHVRQVEQARPLPDRPMLVEDARVLDGHEPAAELDEPRAERAMDVDQRRLVELLCGPLRSHGGGGRGAGGGRGLGHRLGQGLGHAWTGVTMAPSSAGRARRPDATAGLTRWRRGPARSGR